MVYKEWEIITATQQFNNMSKQVLAKHIIICEELGTVSDEAIRRMKEILDNK